MARHIKAAILGKFSGNSWRIFVRLASSLWMKVRHMILALSLSHQLNPQIVPQELSCPT